MSQGSARARQGAWLAVFTALALCLGGPTWAQAQTTPGAESRLALTPQVNITSWTRPNGNLHEVAAYRPKSAQAEDGPIERVYVVPGSGCAGMAPILPGYFEGLAAREIVVLHKRHVKASDWPRPAPCRPGFIQSDELPAWAQAWREFLAWDLQQRPVSHRQVLLLGISEGAELIPFLMSALPHVGMAVLLGSTGLDPWDALLLQLAREQDLAFAGQLQAQLDAPHAASTPPVGGRSLNYWRTLRHWPVAELIGQSGVPTLVLMGSADPVQAPEGLARFKAHHQRALLCTRLIAGADHGLHQLSGRWQGLWPLIQDLMSATDAQRFAQRCAQPD